MPDILVRTCMGFPKRLSHRDWLARFVPFLAATYGRSSCEKVRRALGMPFLPRTVRRLTACAFQTPESCKPDVLCTVGGLLPGISLHLSSITHAGKLRLRSECITLTGYGVPSFLGTAFAAAFSSLLAAVIIKMEGVGNRGDSSWYTAAACAQCHCLRSNRKLTLFTILFRIVTFTLLPHAVPLSHETEQRPNTNALHDDGIIPSGECDRSRLGRRVHEWRDSLRRCIAQPMRVPPSAVIAVFSISHVHPSDYGKRGLAILSFAALAAIGFATFYLR
ncbi:hypothetical protein C8Q76DRAFT_403614 [Earliella scabrosa]|nr:hypothetical protein C8Q76DRAFT_403614 [Earliella scabrosa]